VTSETAVPTRRPTTGDEAIDRIRDRIVSGRYRPGDRLPPEHVLAAEIGVSRNALREAVRALRLVGVLDVRHGDGTYVTALQPDSLLGGTGFVAELLTGDTVLELYEARRILEPALAALAAARVDEATLDALDHLLDVMESAEGFEERMVDADMAFHRTISRASGNTLLASLIDNLSGRTLRLRVIRGRTEPGLVERTRLEHRAIYQALVDRDPDMARTAAAMHIAGGELWLRASMRDDLAVMATEEADER
jgi:DNA-binding FadR family transcriptional regulator